MSYHLKAAKRSEIEERLQAPQMVAAAADLTQYILGSDPNRWRTAEGLLEAPIS